MVFIYTDLRTGTLPSPTTSLDTHQSTLCYMGLDKHENELLINSGVPTDVWFHVDDLSSAHVYLRLPSVSPALTLDDVPEETLEDMCQLVKNNSISGCKLNSCKIVYTFHSNLKKDLQGMDVGTVGFHDYKKCRFRRAVKDRPVVKRLEKSKQHVDWNYSEINRQWVERERLRRKAINKAQYENNKKGGGVVEKQGMEMFDVLGDAGMDDAARARARLAASSEMSSGLDAALEALEEINIAVVPKSLVTAPTSAVGGEEATEAPKKKGAEWKMDAEARRASKYDDVQRWLMERGYRSTQASSLNGEDPVKQLKVLFLPRGMDLPAPGDEKVELRNEEKVVLDAIFGEEAFDETFTFAIPVIGFEPPPMLDADGIELTLEVYGDLNNYPYEPPVIAIRGGGLPERGLREITRNVSDWLKDEFPDRVGDPIIFDVANIVLEKAEEWAEKEVEERKKRKKARDAEKLKKSKAEAQKSAKEKESRKAMTAKQRSKDAKERLGNYVSSSAPKISKSDEDRIKYKSQAGPSQQDLFDDLFS